MLRHNLYNKNFIYNNFIKKADFPMFKGEVNYGNRSGLYWKRYKPGMFTNLPEMATRVLNRQIQDFKKNYEKFAVNKKGNIIKDFSGLLFTIYAEDRSINKDNISQIPEDLKNVAEFVRRNEIKLVSSKENPNKQIGSDFWLSHFAYAWRDMYPNEVDIKKGREDIARPREIKPLTNEKFKRYDHGPLVVGRTKKGLGLFIKTNKEEMVPIYIGQSAAGLKKYFVDNLSPNQSRMLIEESGDIIPATLPRSRSNWNSDHEEIFNRRDEFWIFKIDDDNTIYAERDNQRINLNQRQIEQICKRIGASFYIVPAVESENSMMNMGPWVMTEELKSILSNPEETFSFPKLLQLRMFLESQNPNMHTPLEGFKIITIGPIFSRGLISETGDTMGHSQFATDLTKTDPSATTKDDFIEVKRGIKWVVLANEVSETRMSNQGIETLRPSVRTQGDAERSVDFNSPQEAISYVREKYIGQDSSILSELSNSVKAADIALNNAVKNNL